MRSHRLFCLIFVAALPLPAQTPPPRTAALSRESLSVAGLTNAKVAANIYGGDFADVGLERNNMMFGVLFSQYLDAYARRCDAALPPNKVEIMRSVCARESTPVNRYGAPVGATTCVEYRSEGTGLYANPALYAARQELDRATALDNVGQVFREMGRGNPLDSAMHTVNDAQRMSSDMALLVANNACKSPALKRFEQNLMLFAGGKSPIRLDGSSPASVARPANGAAFHDSNYTRLVEDLVFEQSKSWMMNRFVPDSVSSVAVGSRDPSGRPVRITANYLFNGRTRGSVTVTFSDGLPACLYFFDLPSVCRAASSRVIAAYETGKYR